MKSIKTFEEHIIINSSEIKDNLSPEYHINIKKGKKPYIKKNNFYEEVKTKTIPKNVEYLYSEQVEKYNKISEKIHELEEEQKKLLKNKKKN